jgi:hypothetical protein
MFEIPDADALRALLDELNQEGTIDRVSGIDAAGEPFLAFLAGVYAESAGAIAGNPCDPEVDPPGGRDRCPECGCMSSLYLTELAYPVVVIR